MQAVICRAWGEVDSLTLDDVKPPTPGPGQLLIDVKATGINYADALMVAGRYQTRPEFPFSPGLETAGVGVGCGEDVARVPAGGRVVAILPFGGVGEGGGGPGGGAVPRPARVGVRGGRGVFGALG